MSSFLPASPDTAGTTDRTGRDHAIARRASFHAGMAVFEKGQPRSYAYIIERGEIHIKDGGKDSPPLCVLGPGDIFGEMALIDEGPRTASAFAAEDTETFVISRQALQDKIESLDPLLSLLIGLLVERYRVTRMHLPESVKEDKSGDLMNKLSRFEHISENRVRIWNIEEQRILALQELRMEQEIRRALENREFEPYLQPILDLSDRKITGFEALIRWNHPERGVLAPNHFIPVAERTNTVQLLDRMMLEKACEALPDFINALENKARGFFISVNLSGINFGSAGLVETTREILGKLNADPRHIRLEITESALVGDAAQAETILKGLKELGLTIALDDFGTGYSSLGYLHRFPIDTIKIDRSFIRELHTNSKSIDIVRAIVAMARTFKLSVVAEGIEHEQEVLALKGIGCDMGQGYLFGKPMNMTASLDFLRGNSGAAP